MVDDREFWELKQKVEHLPDHKDLNGVRREASEEIREAANRIEKALEKHELNTKANIAETVRKEVEAAFNLQKVTLEAEIARRVPEQKTDWKPYITLGVVVVVFGLERAWPIIKAIL